MPDAGGPTGVGARVGTGRAPVPSTAARTPDGLVERCGWSLVWLAVLIGGTRPVGVVDGVGAGRGGGPAAGPGAVSPASPPRGSSPAPGRRSCRSPPWSSASVSVLGNQGAGIHLRQFYTTDSAAFTQAAARLVQRGHQPLHDLPGLGRPAPRRPRRPTGPTPWPGGHVTQVSYPAGSFLLEVPGSWPWASVMLIVDWTDLVAWVVTGVLLFVLVPASVRWFAVLLFTCRSSPPSSARAARTPPSCPSSSSRCGGGTGSAPDAAPAWPGGWARWPWAWPARSSRPRGSASRSSPSGLFLEARATGPPTGARGGALPGRRGRGLRRRQPALHRLAALGLAARDAPPAHPSAGGRRAGPDHPGHPRHHPVVCPFRC